LERTRLSLYYLATYLPFAGFGLLLVPDFATKLLLSNLTYDDVFPLLAGVLLLAIWVLIVQIIRHRVEALYPWTVVVRIGLSAVLLALFIYSGDPFFAVIFAIVFFGVLLTGATYLWERGRLSSGGEPAPNNS
jgi:drug/metabolite transporter (DMT)-like permease